MSNVVPGISPVAIADMLTEPELNALPVGMIQLDRNGIVLRYNTAEAQLAQLDPVDVVGCNFFTEVAPCTQVQQFEGRFREGVSKRSLHAIFPYDFKFKHGDRRVSVTLFYSNATDTVWVQVGEVIGNRELRETVAEEALVATRAALIDARMQLLQAQKMEAMGRLAGSVAHDFNNFLTAIIGNAQLAAMEIEAASPVHELINEILKVSDRAHGLTRQLLTFSRGDAVRRREVEINQATAAIESMLRRLVPDTITLRTVLLEGGAKVLADPGQLDQVIMNLVVNARDAIGEHGEILVKTGCSTITDPIVSGMIGTIAPGDYATIEVTDNGHGMDEATVLRIFEPFYTTKPEGQGTGLGLATVYGIVEQSDGRLQVESQPGAGTTFRMYLPLLS